MGLFDFFKGKSTSSWSVGQRILAQWHPEVYFYPGKMSAQRVIANPGAVGQPRDQVPLAAYALFDVPTMSIDFYRVEFDVVAVQTAVRAAGYPEVLATRLAVGR